MMINRIFLFMWILKSCVNEDVGWHSLGCISSDEILSGSLWATRTTDRTYCLWECYRSPRCKSFSYDRFHRYCRGYRNYINDNLQDSHDTDHDWYNIEYYNMWPVGGTRLIGSSCKQDRDCEVDGSQCYRNTCLCNFGWTYDSADMSCVANCQNYGSNFSKYPETMANVVGLYSSTKAVNAPEKCKDECLRWTNGVCVIAWAMPSSTGGFFFCEIVSENSATLLYQQLATVYVRHCA